MIKRLLTLGLLFASLAARAQATLGTSPYIENFDNLASGLPTGFSVYTAATATSLGTSATPALTPGATTTAWTATGGGFKNVASATGLHSSTPAAVQAATTNRALGLRQVSATDKGSAFVFEVANTTGKTNFALSFKLQSLDSTSMRTTTWAVDYGTGASPTTFTTVGPTATTGPVFSNNTLTVSFGSALDNQSGPVWIRIAELNATTLPAGVTSGNRPTTAIDDFSLSWSTPTATTPVLTVSATALAFGKQTINQPSAAMTYTLTGSNLTNPVTVRTAAPFGVSKDGTTFSDSLIYAVTELAQPQSVYVRFTPTTLGQASGPVSGVITNRSTGVTTRIVTLTGTGNDPTQTV